MRSGKRSDCLNCLNKNWLSEVELDEIKIQIERKSMTKTAKLVMNRILWLIMMLQFLLKELRLMKRM